jgi:hypothetical protein
MTRTAMFRATLNGVLFGLSACGGQVAIGGAQPTDGGGSSSVPSLDGAASADAADEVAPSMSAEAGVASAAQMAPIATDVRPLAPGEEATVCQTFANPYGKDVDLLSIERAVDSAVEVFLFRIPASSGSTQPVSLADCSEDLLGLRPILYLSFPMPQTQTMAFPVSGYPLAARDSLMIRVHYVNTSTTTVQSRTALSLGATPRTTGVHVGSIFLRHTGFSIAPEADGGLVTVTSSTTPFTQASWIFASWSFVGPVKAAVQATANGMPFYDAPNLLTSGPSRAIQQQDPDIPVAAAEPIGWSCTYTGPSQMQAGGQCVYQGDYYPADPQNPDQIVDMVAP